MGVLIGSADLKVTWSGLFYLNDEDDYINLKEELIKIFEVTAKPTTWTFKVMHHAITLRDQSPPLDVWTGLVSGMICGLIILERNLLHHLAWEPSGLCGFLASLSIQALKSGLFVHSRHAWLAIVAPLVNSGLPDYTSTLSLALPIGIMGGGISFCTLSAIVGPGISGKLRGERQQETDPRKITSVLAVPLRGTGISCSGNFRLYALGYTSLSALDYTDGVCGLMMVTMRWYSV
ncbi:hypothetical protein B0H17DRAFT_1136626 [Mycena rosella]|uniref:Uncharacterized protein n=1 Tax=Mycena rosella TaxID=1033263 RepID=A0AAD7DAE9_MYCRO|nr:hypothetical protein B0H17DRAFT_1136626 [Mycena rosella]